MLRDDWGKLFDDRSQPFSVQSEKRGKTRGMRMEGVDCLITPTKEREETPIFGLWGTRCTNYRRYRMRCIHYKKFVINK